MGLPWMGKNGYGNRNRRRDGYRSGGRRDYRRDSRDRRTDRYVEEVGLELEENCAGGKRVEPVTPVARKATLPRTAGRRETGSLERRAAFSNKDDFMISPDLSNKYLEDKVVFDQSKKG